MEWCREHSDDLPMKQQEALNGKPGALPVPAVYWSSTSVSAKSGRNSSTGSVWKSYELASVLASSPAASAASASFVASSSTTDPEARLSRKGDGRASKLSYLCECGSLWRCQFNPQPH